MFSGASHPNIALHSIYIVLCCSIHFGYKYEKKESGQGGGVLIFGSNLCDVIYEWTLKRVGITNYFKMTLTLPLVTFLEAI